MFFSRGDFLWKREHRGGKILVVDNTPSNQFLLTQILESSGYIVDGVDNGISAIELAKSDPPNLILMEVA